MNRRLQTAFILLSLFLAAWLPRIVGLEGFVTIDERKWLARSANFYQAISAGDWANTFQREHPGVTVMWAGALAFLQRYPTYPQESPGQFTWEREHFEAWLTANTPLTPLAMLASGRWWIVLLISLALALSYLPLRTLLGTPGAALAMLFVGWDPFAIALSQELHPDGLVSVLTFLALLLFLAWLYGGRQRHYLISSALVMGLAWLTKTPAIFLMPVGVVLILIEGWRARGQGAGSREQSSIINPQSPISFTPSPPHPLILSFVIWAFLATLTFILLWPAMWLDPLGTLLKMANEMGEYVERHTTINYFLGQPVDDPGPIFYPIAFLFRTTPATLIGLLLAGVAAWRRSLPLDRSIIQRTAFALLLFALLFTLGMTLGAKKFDRYLLPAFPPLDMIAALGWLTFGDWKELGVRSPRPFTPSSSQLVSFSPALLVCLFLHALPGWLHHPYYLTYYNPLTGGSRTAPNVLFIGWGEGLDQAAAWLNEQPDAEKLRVVSWYADGPFSYFFNGEAVQVGYSSPLFWLDTDYTVLYINQWQRQQPSPEVITWFASQTPAYTVRSGGLDLARVYDMREMLLPPFVKIGKDSAADFGGKIRLSAYDIPQGAVQPGAEFPITLYLQSLAPMEVNYNILVRLIAADGSELWRAEGWPWGAPTTNWPVREIRPDGHTVVIPTDAQPGPYKLTVSIYDPATFEPLLVTAVKSDQVLDPGERAVALLWVGVSPTAQQVFDPPWQFDQTFTLAGATLPTQVAAGGDLGLALQWNALAQTSTDYTVFVHVVDPIGTVVAQQDRPPLNGFAPTHLWTLGLSLVDEYAIPLPSDLPAGEYEVRAGLYTLDGGRLPVSRNGAPVGDYAVVGSLDIK